MKKGPESDLLERYVDRAAKTGRQLGIQEVDASEWAESRAAGAGQRKADEASRVLSSVRPGALLIALDENGKDIDSEGIASLIQRSLADGVPEICLAIGGPDGHGRALLEKADMIWRFGRVTWPHQLVRVLAAEQLYRATTILCGHPYHRE
ncbi:23S rRNA (pseudouridine(1915)-N(3))-methyltransferase RlmH [Salaquimonas pukyongi]|uniref:23S rRNA (pseudouridine(1915)-N(3))-methyltransferase RlmH n=1 Tax=Salaquimonas pukyongi TaxID=2712698 RepID=UPI003D180D81